MAWQAGQLGSNEQVGPVCRQAGVRVPPGVLTTCWALKPEFYYKMSNSTLVGIPVLHTIRGVVIQGKQRGKKLGIPTINMRIVEDIPHGVYISRIKIENRIYNSVSFVGEAKTFDEKEIYLETLILDFDNDVYGIQAEVFLLKKIRDNFKFASAQELVSQIEKDKKQAIDFLIKNQP